MHPVLAHESQATVWAFDRFTFIQEGRRQQSLQALLAGAWPACMLQHCAGYRQRQPAQLACIKVSSNEMLQAVLSA